MSDISELTAIQRCATVITAIGAENAANVYRFLGDDEVEKLTYEVSTLPYTDVTTVNEVLNEFYELCLTQKVITEGGVATVPGSCFGCPGHIRISYCCSDTDLEKGMDRLEHFLRKIV